jgi:oligosaccharyltransferase complex subunit alpha (ribophorin I)
MDTIGRTALTLHARNLVDAVRDRELIVTYEYPLTAALRKPVMIIVSVLGLFVAVFLLGSLKTGISAKRV